MAYEIGNMVSSPEDISALFNITDSDPVEDTKPQEEKQEDTDLPIEEENNTKVTEMTPEELLEVHQREQVMKMIIQKAKRENLILMKKVLLPINFTLPLPTHQLKKVLFLSFLKMT